MPKWKLAASFDRGSSNFFKRREAEKETKKLVEKLQRFEKIEDEIDHLRKAVLAQHHGVATRLLEHSAIIRNQPAPPPNHPEDHTISGGWEGKRAGGDFIWSKNALVR